MLPPATVCSLSPGNHFEVTPEVKAAFDEYGFILIRGLLTSEEMTHLRNSLESDHELTGSTHGKDDSEGRRLKISIWNHPGDDLTGLITRSEKVAGTFDKLLGGEVYHYHSKLIQKDAFEGGAVVWHQDYGYWYHNGCLFPNMGTLFLPIDRTTKENGCLRVLPKSHHAGRLKHHLAGEQARADLERVEQLKSVLGEEVAVEMEAGDALFFHANLLHTSAKNDSPNRRWALVVAYNRADNDPVIEHHYPRYTPLQKVRNSDIMELALKLPKSSENRDYLKGDDQKSGIRLFTQEQNAA